MKMCTYAYTPVAVTAQFSKEHQQTEPKITKIYTLVTTYQANNTKPNSNKNRVLQLLVRLLPHLPQYVAA